MNKYTTEIMTLIKNVFTNVVGEFPFQTESEAKSYYLKNLDDNLYKPMNEAAKKAYGQGSGNEIASGKMNALRSSSALTYNLFWNQVAKINGNSERIGANNYTVEFEKQYHTLKSSVTGAPANLDAFLYSKENCEAVACEMKMMEWIFNKPSSLKNKYLAPENYIDEKAGKVFVEIAKELVLQSDYDSSDYSAEEYPCRMTRYDAFQMFKHAIACYTACVSEEERKIKKLTLVNCAWTLSIPEVLSPKNCERYVQEEECEHREFNEFKLLMHPVKKLFSDISVDFDICFYTLSEFLSLMDKTDEEVHYLRRYTLK